MKILVVTTETELESAKRLAFPDTVHHFTDYAHKYDKHVVIRWGNSRWMYNKDGSERNAEFKNVINSAKSIRLNCQKHKSLKLLAQVVNVPTIYEKSVPAGVLAVIRRFEHASGSDFSVKEGPFKIEPETYGTKFIKTDAEYRVWFCGDRTMSGRRIKLERNAHEDMTYPCRSNWGYEFADRVSPELHYQTLMAAKKIGLDCGAADVLFYKGKYYFLELNSAASVDHRRLREFYQNALEELMRKKFPELFGISQPASVSSPVEVVKKNIW